MCVLCCSPSGKLVQIEYALQAVAAGAPSVGIKGMHLRKRWGGGGDGVGNGKERSRERGDEGNERAYIMCM